MNRIPSFITNSFQDMPAPASPEAANENLEKLAFKTRRAFLGGSLAAAAVPAAMMAGSSRAEAQGVASPTNTIIKTPANEGYFQEIQRNEAAHVQIVIGAIQSLGGTPRPYPTFRNIVTTSPTVLLELATTFENTGVSAYFGASPYLYNPAVKAVTTSLALVEAYQGGYLNTLSNQPLVPGGMTYARMATIPEVLAVVDPYIVSLNDNGEFPPTFGMTPSPENDIAILNFALILEYLEASFYYYSVNSTFA